MNLLLIGYCHLNDGFLYAAKALEKVEYKIFFFQYSCYMMDNIEDRDEILVNFINENNINICLWWNNNIKYDNIEKVVINVMNKYIQHIFFNWDPFLYNYQKYNCITWKERVDDKIKCYSLMNYVLSCFETEINYYNNKDSFNICYAPPGFDLNISKYEYDENYICDISIVCTNMYNNASEFPDESTNITRYSIVDKLYENRDKINFHIYGIERFKDIYPECYKGFINYHTCNKVFSNSKINLSIHPLIKELNGTNSKEEYFSERLPQILGSKGLLMTNSLFTDKLIKDEDYVHINNDMDWYEKVIDIINNTKEYDIIRENGQTKALKYYQWDNWANIVNSVIQK